MNGLAYRKNMNFIAGTSYPEQFFVRSLQQIYQVEHRRKEPEIGLEFDIGIEELNLRIEYSGDYWHIGKEKNDSIRRIYCKNKTINYIEIIESVGKGDTVIYKKDLYTRIYVYTGSDFVKKNDKLIAILKYILRLYGHDIKEVDIDRAVCESFVFCKRYNYNIIRKQGKIIGTEDKVYVNNEKCVEYMTDDIETTFNEDGIIIKNATDKDIDKDNIRMKIEDEEEDSTLVKNKVSTKRFNQHCKMVMKNWDMY